jgi:mono/diheme cytochrome c family protein
MKAFSTPPFLAGLWLLVCLSFGPAQAQQPDQPGGWFATNPAWTLVENVAPTADGSHLFATTGHDNRILFLNAARRGTPHLRTAASVGDCLVTMEYLLRADARAGIYLHTAYRIQLDGDKAGSLGVMVNGNGKPDPVGIVPPLHPVVAPPGTWQRLEARIRAPRYNAAGAKMQNAVLLEVKINDVVVQSNTLATGWCAGTEFPRETSDASTTIAVDAGGMAIREFSLRRADFEAITLPPASGQATNAAELVDAVQQGATLFRTLACFECHATQPDDPSPKAGPNQFGLFQVVPRDREIAAAGEGNHFIIKADHAYLLRSLRTPLNELAIAERGPTTGTPYLPAMPPYLPTVLSDAQIDSLEAYLATLNEPANQGPVIKLVRQADRENTTR